MDSIWNEIMREEKDKKKNKGVRYIPWIGDVLYYRRDASELVGVGGRGRDDYVKRSLNNMHKIAKERQLTEDELAIYLELIRDAEKYPQTKLVKGEEEGEFKEKRAINVDKHWDMYDEQK